MSHVALTHNNTTTVTSLTHTDIRANRNSIRTTHVKNGTRTHTTDTDHTDTIEEGKLGETYERNERRHDLSKVAQLSRRVGRHFLSPRLFGYSTFVMKIFILLLLGVIAVTQAVSFFDLVLEEWTTFKIEHRKNYKSDVEEKFRMKIFMDNKKKIAQHNRKFELGQVSYKMKLNKYGDMLHHEFVSTLNGFNKSVNIQLRAERQPIGAKFIEPAHVELPESVDWRKEGAVTGIKDQGHCGSCWAFSATGSLEAQHFRQTGVLVSLSEQNLIDCSGKYGNNGCEGGLMDQAFQYVKDNRGLDTEKSYPYEAENDRCRYNPRNNGAVDVGYVDVPEGDEKKLKAAVATVGPISVAIDASHQSFQFYSEGVYNEPECSNQELDHGVLVVGYGVNEDGTEYWLVKNSWGETWGDHGYIKMARNMDNQCGIATSASYPLV